MLGFFIATFIRQKALAQSVQNEYAYACAGYARTRSANVSSMRNDRKLWRGFLILCKHKNFPARWKLRNSVCSHTHAKVTGGFSGYNTTQKEKWRRVKIWYFIKEMIFLLSSSLFFSVWDPSSFLNDPINLTERTSNNYTCTMIDIIAFFFFFIFNPQWIFVILKWFWN